MATKVPYPRVSLPGLDRAEFEIQRNFEALADAVTSSVSGFDALIDPTQAGNGTTRFQTVGAALAALSGDLTLGVAHTATIITETGILAFGTRRIRLVGLGAALASTIYQQWDLAGFLATGNTSVIQIENMRVLNSGALVATLFPGTLIAINSEVLQSTSGGTGTNATDVVGSAGAFIGIGVFWQGMSINVGTYRVQLYNATIQNRTNGATVIQNTHDVYIHGGFDTDSTGLTFSGAGKTILDITDALSSTGSGASTTLTFNGTGAVYMRAYGRSAASQLHVTVAAGAGDFIGEGYFGTLTVAAPSSANTIRQIRGAARGGLDITGPAEVDVIDDAEGGTGDAIFRGDHVNATVHAISVSTTGVIKFRSLTDSVVRATVRNPGAAGTTKPYDIDVGSVRNILIIAGASNGWGVSGANASTTTVIINETGPSFVDSVRKDMLPSLLVEPVQGVNTIGGTVGTVTSVQLNMGSAPVLEKTFQVTDITAKVGMKIMVVRANDATTDHPADEAEMDPLFASARVVSAGIVEITVAADAFRGPVYGNYLFDYVVPAQQIIQGAVDFNQTFMLMGA